MLCVLSILLVFEHFLSLLAQPDAPGSDTTFAQPRQTSSRPSCSGDEEKGKGRDEEALSSNWQINFYPPYLPIQWGDLKGDKFSCPSSVGKRGSVRAAVCSSLSLCQFPVS